MITVNNKQCRNLQEQVYYLTDRIGDATDVVKKVVAKLAAVPSTTTGYNAGDTIAVGTSSPYEYYVVADVNGSLAWVDIGQYPKAGPTGATGATGATGPKGDTGDTGATGVGINNATINSSGHLILTLTDGTSIDAGTAKGDPGADGIGLNTLSSTTNTVINTVLYDVNDGATIIGNETYTYTGGTKTVQHEYSFPVKPSTGINIDANEDNDALLIKNDGVVSIKQNGTTLTKDSSGNVEINPTLTHATYTLSEDVPFNTYRYIYADGLKTSASGTALNAKYLYITIRQPNDVTVCSLNVGLCLTEAVEGTSWVTWGPIAGWNQPEKFIYVEAEDVGGMYKAKSYYGNSNDNNYVKYDNMYLWNDGQMRPSTQPISHVQFYSSGSTSLVIPAGTVIDLWYK